MIIYQSDSLSSLYILADEIRQEIAKYDFVEVPQVTASFGITLAQPSDTQIKEIIVRADIYLYEAKKKGRNCVMPISRRKDDI